MKLEESTTVFNLLLGVKRHRADGLRYITYLAVQQTISVHLGGKTAGGSAVFYSSMKSSLKEKKHGSFRCYNSVVIAIATARLMRHVRFTLNTLQTISGTAVDQMRSD